MRLIQGIFLLLAFSGTAFAETAYITDNLRLGLHQAPDTSDRAFRTLESGQEIEILSRDRNYAHVQLPDGVQGYVKAAYLVFEKPAKLIVSETQARVDEPEEELSRTKAAFAAPGETIATLEAQLEQSQAELEQVSSNVIELTSENEKYRRRHEQFKFSVPLSWVGGAVAICLLAGFLTGMWWIDYRSRKRHGGIRVY